MQVRLRYQRERGLSDCVRALAETAEPYYAILDGKLETLAKSGGAESFAEKWLETTDFSAVAARILRENQLSADRLEQADGLAGEIAGCQIRLRPISYRYAETSQRALLVTLRRGSPGIVQLDPAAAKKYDLTRRETEVAEMLARGCTNREIAEAMHISANTAKVHLANLFRKLGAATRIEAISKLKA